MHRLLKARVSKRRIKRGYEGSFCCCFSLRANDRISVQPAWPPPCALLLSACRAAPPAAQSGCCFFICGFARSSRWLPAAELRYVCETAAQNGAVCSFSRSSLLDLQFQAQTWCHTKTAAGFSWVRLPLNLHKIMSRRSQVA